MNQENYKIIDKLGIRTDAVVINQSLHFEYRKIRRKENNILFISLPERGVGLSRNTALNRADGDIGIFADDDMTFEKNYEETIINEFESNPHADIILFNVPSANPDRPTVNIEKRSKVHKINSLRYGAVNIAFRTKSLKKADISFSLLFGGGAPYSAGEDSLFIYQCLRKKLKVYTCPLVIGYVSQESSSWFNGFNDKYFMDKGAFFKCLSPRFFQVFIIQYVIRKYPEYREYKSPFQVFRLIYKGAKGF